MAEPARFVAVEPGLGVEPRPEQAADSQPSGKIEAGLGLPNAAPPAARDDEPEAHGGGAAAAAPGPAPGASAARPSRSDESREAESREAQAPWAAEGNSAAETKAKAKASGVPLLPRGHAFSRLRVRVRLFVVGEAQPLFEAESNLHSEADKHMSAWQSPEARAYLAHP
jgi:hypothetical protein